MQKIVIIGAGITGMFLAYELSRRPGYEVTLVERSNHLGGASSSFVYKDFILDFGPHKIYTQLPGILQEYKNLLGDDLLKVKKRNTIFLFGKAFDFPVRFPQLALGIPPLAAAKMGIGFGTGMAGSVLQQGEPKNYEEYFLRGFGKQAYRLLFESLAWKVWGDPKKLSAELARKRVPISNAFTLIKTALVKPDKKTSAEYFYYPRKGMRMLIERLEEALQHNNVTIVKQAEATRIEHANHKAKSAVVRTPDGEKTIAADTLVSTIGLNHLIPLLHPLSEQAIQTHAKQLKYRSIIVIYLFLDRDKVLNEHWVFFPERAYIFNRIAELKNFSKAIGPRGKTVLTAEITVDEHDPLFKKDDKTIVDRVVKDLVKAGIITKGMVYDHLVQKAKNLYPVYSIDYRSHLDPLLDYVDGFTNLFTIGRQGFFNYNNTDHDIDMAKRTAAFITAKKPKKEWKRLRKHFDSYQIVD